MFVRGREAGGSISAALGFTCSPVLSTPLMLSRALSSDIKYPRCDFYSVRAHVRAPRFPQSVCLECTVGARMSFPE